MPYSDNEIKQIIEEFLNDTTARQYIGARYVPIFGRKGEDSIEWDNSLPYESLTIVLYQGNSYTSRQYVPTGVEITNDEFWAKTGDYNAQIEQYRQEVQELALTVDALDDAVDILNDTVYIEQFVDYYGADREGNLDSSSAIAQCIEANAGGTIYFSPGTYLISEPIKTPHLKSKRVSIDFNNATIIPTDNMDYILGIGYDGVDITETAQVNKTYYKNGNFKNDSDYAARGIYVKDYYKNPAIQNMNIDGFKIGVQLGTTAHPIDCQITNCFIHYSNSFDTDGVGVLQKGTDNKINDCRIYGFYKAIQMDGSSLFVDNVHNLPAGDFNADDPTSYTDLADTCFIEVNNYGLYISNCFCDTAGIFFLIKATTMISATNCHMFSYLNPMDMAFLKYTVNQVSPISLINCNMIARSKFDGTANRSVVFTSTNNAANLKMLRIENCYVGRARDKVYAGDLFAETDKFFPYWSHDTFTGWLPLFKVTLPKNTAPGPIDVTVTRYFETSRTMRIYGEIAFTANPDTVDLSNIVCETESFPDDIGYSCEYDNNNINLYFYCYADSSSQDDVGIVNNGYQHITPCTNSEQFSTLATVSGYAGLDFDNITTIYNS